MTLNRVVLFLMFFAANWVNGTSQPALQNDFSYTLEVPSVVAMESSAAHLYVLSESEGMAVFRTRRDSLQWLYTASGMQRRGTTLRADIRFAYLLGDGNRLTVLEPTSVMGAYSSATLPQSPQDVVRVDESLYVALGEGGLGVLNLETPETLDSPVEPVKANPLNNQSIIGLDASSDKLYALSDNGKIFVFNKNMSGFSFDETISIDQDLNSLFYSNNFLMGATSGGDIFEIASNGTLNSLGSIDESVVEIESWNEWLIIRGESNRLWTSYQFTEPTLWKKNRDGGNYLTSSKGQLWISEYDRISRIREISAQEQKETAAVETTADLEIEPISDKIIPYPHALLLPIKLKGNYPVQNVKFSLQTSVENAQIRGQSLYWKPEARQEGEHQFKVVAAAPDGQTSTASFTVDVQPFNTPPRFTPMRTISIPLGRSFSLPINATDPDGINKNLIRYFGVNLPEEATIDEATGELNWRPTERHIGENTFRVIATDQYGAASSQEITIRVIDTGSGEN